MFHTCFENHKPFRYAGSKENKVFLYCLTSGNCTENHSDIKFHAMMGPRFYPLNLAFQVSMLPFV